MSIKEIMDVVGENQEKALKYKAYSSVPEPEVGMFWVYQGKVYGHSKTLLEADTRGLFKYDVSTHCLNWDSMKSRNPELPQDKEFNEVPRGRVVYNVATWTYHIIANLEMISNPEIVENLKKFFLFREDTKVVLEVEPQYAMDFRG
jgi:hypothetical protein